MLKRTRDFEIGSRVDIGFATDSRGVIVTSNDDDGFGVIWYTDRGLGPMHAVLPHSGHMYVTRYIDERVTRQHYTETHPDFTGKTGEF